MASSKSLEKLDELRFLIDSLSFLKKAFESGIEGEEEFVKSIGLTADELLKIKAMLDVDVIDSRSSKKMPDVIRRLNEEYIRELEAFFGDSSIFILYDWRKILETRWRGLFRSQPVRAVTRSRVLFLSVLEVKWKDVSNRDCVGFFGSGIYSVEFVPSQSDTPIEHFVPVNGILLTKEQLNQMFSSPIRVETTGFSVHKELVSRIFLKDLAKNPRIKKQTSNLLMFEGLKGRKEVLEFLEKVREASLKEMEPRELVFLSGLPDFKNKLIVSLNKFEELIRRDIKGEPGLAGYDSSLEKLSDLYSVMDLDTIYNNVRTRLYHTLRYAWGELLDLFK